MNDFRDIHELYHFGIKGQKWGIRRYQNEDGSLTEKGKNKSNNFLLKQTIKDLNYNETVRVHSQAHIDEASFRKFRIESKKKKLESEGKTLSERKQKTLDYLENTIKKYKNNIKGIKTTTYNIIKDNKATIGSKKSKIYARSGADIVLTMLGADSYSYTPNGTKYYKIKQ